MRRTLIKLVWAAMLAVLAIPASASAWVSGTKGPILYSSAEGAPGDPVGFHIWAIRPDGTGKRELTHGNDQWPALAPSGRQFVFARAESFGGPIRERLYVADSNGGSPHLLTNPTVPGEDYLGDTQPTFSPDGAHIAFVRRDANAENIWVMDADGTSQHQLTDFAGTFDIRGLSWSPDNHNLLFQTSGPLGPAGASASGGSVYEMTVAGATIHQVLPIANYLPGLDWSPSGVAVPSFDADRILVVPLGASGSASQVAGSGAIEPSWAPDATDSHVAASLAYLAGGITHTELFTTTTGNNALEQELTFDGFAKQSDAWAPGLPHFNPGAIGFTVKRPVELGRRTIPVLIHCPSSAGHKGCVDILTLRSARHILVSGHLKLRAGSDRTLTLHLSRSAERKLRERGPAVAALVSKLRDARTGSASSPA